MSDIATTHGERGSVDGSSPTGVTKRSWSSCSASWRCFSASVSHAIPFRRCCSVGIDSPRLAVDQRLGLGLLALFLFFHFRSEKEKERFRQRNIAALPPGTKNPYDEGPGVYEGSASFE